MESATILSVRPFEKSISVSYKLESGKVVSIQVPVDSTKQEIIEKVRNNEFSAEALAKPDLSELEGTVVRKLGGAKPIDVVEDIKG